MSAEAGLRRFLLIASSVTYGASAVELALVEHWHGWTQWLPFVMAGAGLFAALWLVRDPSSRSVGAVRVVSALVVVGSAAGIVLHARGNALFALEVRPDTAGLEVAIEAATGGNPLLAPGMMALAAALAAAATWRLKAGGPRASFR
jgi:hypothetical protein